MTYAWTTGTRLRYNSLGRACRSTLLMRQLGHSTIKMTMRYAAFHPEYSDVKGYLTPGRSQPLLPREQFGPLLFGQPDVGNVCTML